MSKSLAYVYIYIYIYAYVYVCIHTYVSLYGLSAHMHDILTYVCEVSESESEFQCEARRLALHPLPPIYKCIRETDPIYILICMHTYTYIDVSNTYTYTYV